ncbi:hypothetical protein [Aliiroseovarius sp. F47248L]|nr:hypothetical protein [Aliiroseovarius sp. F47248L]
MDRADRGSTALTVLVDLNWDRFFFAGAISAALVLSAALHSFL